MPRLSAKLTKLRIDIPATIKRNDPVIRRAFFKAIKAFLLEAQIHIPLWSGMSRGSLVPAARFVNSKDPGSPAVIILSPLAAKFSRVSKGVELGTFSFRFVDGNYEFIIEPKVEHFFYLDKEAHPKVSSAPWESFKKARIVYTRVLKRELKGLKNPVIIRTRVTTGSKKGLG